MTATNTHHCSPGEALDFLGLGLLAAEATEDGHGRLWHLEDGSKAVLSRTASGMYLLVHPATAKGA